MRGAVSLLVLLTESWGWGSAQFSLFFVRSPDRCRWVGADVVGLHAFARGRSKLGRHNLTGFVRHTLCDGQANARGHCCSRPV
jgi:hypothetical protein